MLEYVYDFFYRLLTFEFDVTGTISSVLLLMTLYRTLAGFFSFLRDSGPLSTLVAAVTTVIVGPLPTLLRLIALPPLRVEAFVRGELLPFFNAADDDEANDVEIEGGLERNARMAEAEAARAHAAAQAARNVRLGEKDDARRRALMLLHKARSFEVGAVKEG